MSGKRSTEHERIHLLAEFFAAPSSFALSIGDDCAVLPPQSSPLALSVDASVEDVHFRRAWMSLADIGFRATMAALSDLAAMGAKPVGILSSLILPREFTDAELLQLMQGQREAAALVEAAVVGGNLARGEKLSITTTVMGLSERPTLRAGAKPGDQLFIAGALGLATTGLRLLQNGETPNADLARWNNARTAFTRPVARIKEGLVANACGAHAMIDLSDGLCADALHLATASNVQLVLDEGLLRRNFLPLLPAQLEDPMAAILKGGEDYALLVAAPANTLPEQFIVIGAVETGEHPALLLSGSNGRQQLSALGFDHFE